MTRRVINRLGEIPADLPQRQLHGLPAMEDASAKNLACRSRAGHVSCAGTGT